MSALELVAIGDSVVWGQGCSESQKFVSLVKVGLEGKRGPTNPPTLLAHSGAWAQSKAGAQLWGEVPMAGPGVIDELRGLRDSGRQPDVLIIDGGINDISAFHIVLANPFDPDGAKDLDKRTRSVFQAGGPVHALLTESCRAFPRATIVVTGYFPIVSASTDLGTLTHLLRLLPGAGLFLRWFGRWGHLLPGTLLGRLVGDEQKQMTEHCRIFLEVAHGCLRALVADLRAQGYSIHFADPGFTDANAYGAPDSWLWDGTNDPLVRDREQRFEGELRRGNPESWPPWTPMASICHPNAQGAEAYARAILACL